jgi:Tfp pilus assembly protein FimT
MLLTVAILSILAAVLIPQLSGDIPERLRAAAQVVVADLDYARSLAVANNSKYTITFDTTNNAYWLRHSGTSALLSTLPRSPFSQTGNANDRQTTSLAELPLPQPGVRLVAIVHMSGTVQSVGSVEFTPLGGTTSPQPTVIWLACASGKAQRFLPIEINAVTGLATTGSLQTALPATVIAVIQGGS